MLYDMTDGQLVDVAATTFRSEGVLERTHLQAAVRDNVSVLGDDLLVVAEEFGDFEDAHRRIDLLCIDRAGRLVVVELKRTEDGGHMELQALRYAAMVSVMTFDELVHTYANHLKRTSSAEFDPDSARQGLLEWMDEVEDIEPVIGREVGIVLVSADFRQEITTTVLWLNEFYGMDIRCVRLTPYRHGATLLLDVQQVIPLPEAEELMVRIKKAQTAARHAKASSKDYTKYIIRTPQGSTQPLAKRRAVLEFVHTLHDAGVPCEALAGAIPRQKFRAAPGVHSGEALWDALATAYGLGPPQRSRWFIDHPIHDETQTWVLSNGWGQQTEETLRFLATLAPPGYGFAADDSE